MKILYVIHSGTNGGTYLTNKDLMKNIDDEYDVLLLTAEAEYFELFTFYDGNLDSIKKYPRDKKWSAKNMHDSWIKYVYFNILTEYNVDIVHIRHLIYHSFDLPEIAKKLGIPTVLSFHDFYFICPFYVLLDENKKFCEGICKDNNKNCFIPWPNILKDINSKELITTWRINVSKMFKNIDYFITTSEIVKDIFINIYPEIQDRFKVIEHGRDFKKLEEDLYEIPSPNKPIKILCPANNIDTLKGSDIIKSIKDNDKNNRIEFHFCGNSKNDLKNYGIIHGRFERDNFNKVVEEIKPSFIGIFSIWPETFCHTITEAWSCGIPVIGSNIGVIEDRILNNNGGLIVNINNTEEILEDIINCDKDKYLKLINNVNKIPFKTTKQMSEEYFKIYENINNHELNIQNLKKENKRLIQDNNRLSKENKKINSNLKKVKKLNKQLINSNSWKITKPIRSVKNKIRK